MFGLLIVFAAAQVWGDLERANSAVANEASALRDIVLLAKSLPEDNNSKLRALVERHIDVSETEEWPAMAKGHAAIAMPTALREALREALICSAPSAIAAQFDGNWSMVAVTTSGQCSGVWNATRP